MQHVPPERVHLYADKDSQYEKAAMKFLRRYLQLGTFT